MIISGELSPSVLRPRMYITASSLPGSPERLLTMTPEIRPARPCDRLTDELLTSASPEVVATDPVSVTLRWLP